MMFNWFKKKPAPVKKLRPVRIAVHRTDGTTVVHYAIYRTISGNGNLCLHDALGGGQVVADYAAGQWASISIGKRNVK